MGLRVRALFIGLVGVLVTTSLLTTTPNLSTPAAGRFAAPTHDTMVGYSSSWTVVYQHIREHEMVERLDRHFTWSGMTKSAREYGRKCDICQRTKAETHQPRGLLHPLPVPDGKWTHITMDLVTCLPETPEGYDAAVVFTDRFTKMVRFAPTTITVTAPQLARIFVEQVFRNFGLPK